MSDPLLGILCILGIVLLGLVGTWWLTMLSGMFSNGESDHLSDWFTSFVVSTVLTVLALLWKLLHHELTIPASRLIPAITTWLVVAGWSYAVLHARKRRRPR